MLHYTLHLLWLLLCCSHLLLSVAYVFALVAGVNHHGRVNMSAAMVAQDLMRFEETQAHTHRSRVPALRRYAHSPDIPSVDGRGA